LIRGGPGLVGNRLEGRPIDSGADVISRPGQVTGVSTLLVEYDASHLYTFWACITSLIS